MRRKEPRIAVDVFWALAFAVLTVCSPFVAKSAYESANGDWMTFIGGGGRSPAVPMWVIFGLWCALALFSLAGTIAYVTLLFRRARGDRG